MAHRSKEVAKFFCGFEAFHAGLQRRARGTWLGLP